MNKKVLIYKSPILLEIFEEIKNNLNFNFSVFSENATNNLDANDNNDYIIISHASNKIKNSYIFIYNVASHYKYVCKMSMQHTDDIIKKGYTSTLILSNFIDITFLEKVFNRIKYSRKVIACNYKDY